MNAFSFELPRPNPFPLGQGPFRARGWAFLGALKYFSLRLRGGKPALMGALDSPELVAFWNQIFIATSDYDVVPLVAAYVAGARVEGVTPYHFVRERARAAGESDTTGAWSKLLKTSSPRAMSKRLNMAFDRYFSPCRAVARVDEPGTYQGVLMHVPACMNGLYTASTEGFVSRALEMAGARSLRFEWVGSKSGGHLESIPTENHEFSATFQDPT
jgi:hypothetical protein